METIKQGLYKLERLGRLLESRPWVGACLIVIAGSLFTVPLALFGFLRGDEMHLFWAKRFSDQLWAGNLYPRWLLEMNSGLGSPTFYFYGPTSYYITSFFFILLPYHRLGWLQVGLSAALASVASGLAAYLWLRQRCSRQAAFIAAILYTWLPYHLRIDHLERFAFAEYWGFVWMPLNLYFVCRLVRGHRKNIVGLAVTYALLLMTHPPTALLFGGLPLLYALVIAVEEKQYRSLAYVAAGVVLGTLLAAIYLIPALTTQSNASLGEMIVGDGSYVNNFVYVKLPGVPGPAQEWFRLWLAMMTKLTVITACVTALLALAGLFGPSRWERFLWSFLALFSLAMMHPLSGPLWKAIPLLQKIQFPWRFHIIVTLAMTAMIAYAIDAIPHEPMQSWRTVAFGLALLLLAYDGIYTLRIARRALLGKVEIPERYTARDYPEYRTRWVPAEIYTTEGVRQLAGKTPAAQVISGQGQVQVEKWSPTGIEIVSNGQSDLQVQVRQFYYPTWRATLENGEVCSTSAAAEGLLTLSVPVGQHRVTLKVGPDRAGKMGRRISLVAAIITLCMLVVLRDAPQSPESP